MYVYIVTYEPYHDNSKIVSVHKTVESAVASELEWDFDADPYYEDAVLRAEGRQGFYEECVIFAKKVQ